MLHSSTVGFTPAISVTSMKKAICSSPAAKKTWSRAAASVFTRWRSRASSTAIADVLEAAVIGVPDPQWGEALKAVIVPKPGAKITGEQLQQFCKERLSAYKVPKSVAFVESLPHTEVGKVNKVKVREMFAAG